MSTSRSRSWRTSHRYLISLLGLASVVAMSCGKTPEAGVPQITSSSQALWTSTGNMITKRYQHTATLLPSGKVLVIGGSNGAMSFTNVELYDPAAGAWSAAASVATARASHRAVLLANGKVLAIGTLSATNAVAASVELYDPATNAWSAAASLVTGRFYHTATVLANGKVLVAGGVPVGTTGSDSAELYDPAANTWTTLPKMSVGRIQHTATLLADGKVLIVGGATNGGGGGVANVEVYDPAANTWTPLASMGTARFKQSAELLPSGQVLVAGGETIINVRLTSTEIYTPATNAWADRPQLAAARVEFTMTGLSGGAVLVAGGAGAAGVTDTAELFYKANGEACTSAGQCQSNFCVDGVCCASACGGGTADCLSCNGTETGGTSGTCARIPEATKFVCRPAANACDVAESCGGSSDSCPADTYQGGVCSVDVGVSLSAMPPSSGSDSLSATVSVTNAGTFAAQRITTTITVPEGAMIQGAVGNSWDCKLNGTTATCTWAAQGAEQVGSIALTILPISGTESITITATAATEPADANPANNTATLDQSLLSQRLSGGGIGCTAAPTSTGAGGLAALVSLVGLLSAVLRRRRAH